MASKNPQSAVSALLKAFGLASDVLILETDSVAVAAEQVAELLRTQAQAIEACGTLDADDHGMARLFFIDVLGTDMGNLMRAYDAGNQVRLAEWFRDKAEQLEAQFPIVPNAELVKPANESTKQAAFSAPEEATLEEVAEIAGHAAADVLPAKDKPSSESDDFAH